MGICLKLHRTYQAKGGLQGMRQSWGGWGDGLWEEVMRQTWGQGRNRQVLDARIPGGHLREVTWPSCALDDYKVVSIPPATQGDPHASGTSPPNRRGIVTHSVCGGFYHQPRGDREQS